MELAELPALTGSALFDPWRLRYREQLVSGGLLPSPRRPTRSELLLWEALQQAPRSWVAEQPTRYGYTLDFYCAEALLAVEVDGASHWGEAKRKSDAVRDEVHGRLGIRTHRFSAREVETDLPWVAAEVERLARRREAELTAAPVVAPVVVVADLADPPSLHEHLRQHPPEPRGWSAFLPACRTVLPVVDGTRVTLRGLLRATR